MSPNAHKEIPEASTAAWIANFGPPQEVIGSKIVALSSPGAGEVLVRLEFAPINPADINVLEGKYGVLPQLPAVPGIEGVGRVVAEGLREPGQESLLGRRVVLPHGYGTWRELGVAKATVLVVVPESIPVQQAAMLRINPATALCLLEEFVHLQPGEWVVQNAANSGVGRAVIQIARACGWRTVNVVRRAGLEEDLRSIGADVVLEEGDHLAKRIVEATDGDPIRLGLNAVGGECALGLAKALAEGGTLATYGAMSLQALRIPNGLLIFKDLSFRGFWVSRWYEKATPERKLSLFKKLFAWAEAGVLHTPVEAVYPLSEAPAAVAHAMRARRSGKVLFQG